AVLFFLLFASVSYSQDNLLKRKVDLNVEQQTIEKILFEISERANFTFSYDVSIFASSKRISITSQAEPVKVILDKLLPKDIDYKVSGNHLILLKTVNIPRKRKKHDIYGAVFSAVDKSPLKNIVVYEVSSLASAVTNEKGQFSMSVPVEFEQLGLSFNQSDVEDTTILITPQGQGLSIYLKPKKPIPYAKAIRDLDYPKPVEKLPIVIKLVSNQSILRTENTNLIIHRPAQISFLPTMGTNLKMGGLVKNQFSFNVLVGYANAVGKVEVGGLFNVIRQEVTGFQLAGLGNLVGGNTKGVQVAGFFNHNRGTMVGVQLGGISNLLIDSLRGVQISGISNVLKGGMKGWQLAGINNLTTRNVEGGQIAGLTNVALGDVEKLQIGGLVNKGRNVSGLQLSGIVNLANGSVKGFQFAGIGNYSSGSVSGTQISGIFNYAQVVQGNQISLINLADSASGTPIGFFSYVKKGFRKLEFSVDEIQPANLSFKTGVRGFYNTFHVGFGSWQDRFQWSFGYGFGTEWSVTDKAHFNFEYSAHWVSEQENIQSDLSLLNRLGVNFGYRKTKRLGFSIGPVLNVWLSEWINPESGEYLTQLAPYSLSTKKLAPLNYRLGSVARLQFSYKHSSIKIIIIFF
uniref:hypothetical protein n=1 Tax=Fulvivirga sp. TaxID=1931237 RepID=UPI00404AB5B1